jgi:hypothetical protein
MEQRFELEPYTDEEKKEIEERHVLESNKDTGMRSVNGIGTTLYGKREVSPSDGTYIATQWFIIFYLPIFPLASYRVRRGKTRPGFLLPSLITDYQLSRVRLNWRQVLNTYLVSWGIAFAWVLFCYNLPNIL